MIKWQRKAKTLISLHSSASIQHLFFGIFNFNLDPSQSTDYMKFSLTNKYNMARNKDQKVSFLHELHKCYLDNAVSLL